MINELRMVIPLLPSNVSKADFLCGLEWAGKKYCISSQIITPVYI